MFHPASRIKRSPLHRGLYNLHMRILVVATKAPWPPIDGGRLILLTTIDALHDLGHEITLVAPVEPGSNQEVETQLAERCKAHLIPSLVRGGLASVAAAEVTRKPVTVIRHEHEQVRHSVDSLLRDQDFDVVHVEQQQALYGVSGAACAVTPVVLRAHNIESSLWFFAADYRPALTRWWFRREANRLGGWEAASLKQVDHTVALTEVDASKVADLVGSGDSITTVEAPFVSDLPACRDRLPGDPAAVILASGAWQPNRDAVWRFATEVWPIATRVNPDARLHVFGVPAPGVHCSGVEWHAPPEHSILAFPEGAVVVIPARHPTGVPMKCLESWARGLPIVGSSLAAEQLDAKDGQAMLIADSAEEFASAFKRLADEPDLRDRLVANGRAMLRSRHDPADVARRLVEVYRLCLEPSKRNDEVGNHE